MSLILVIDDSELISRLLKEALTEEGFEVHTALDANQGYQSAIEATPDLILLDVQLPDVVGLDLIHIIRNRDDLKHVPIIMITGTHGQTANKVKALKDGADDFILKPFEMPELIERIRAVLRRSGRHPGENRGPEPLDSGFRRNDEKKSISPMGNLSALNRPVSLQKSSYYEPPPVPAAAANPSIKRMVSLGDVIRNVLFKPATVSKEMQYPRLAFTYLLAALGLTLAGVALTAGTPIKPVIAGLWVAGTWGLAIATLVMTCSIMGIHMNWKEGARTISMAAVPILLKILGGTLVSLLIGLSPFYFNAGPALFWRNAPWLTERVDFFEIWSAVLLLKFIRQWPGGSKRRGWIATVLVWVVAIAMTGVLVKLCDTLPS